MSEFDFSTVGKKMPYTAPPAEFFEQLSARTLDLIERKRLRSLRFRRTLISVGASVAAVVAMVLLIEPQWVEPGVMSRAAQVALIDNSFDQALNAYVENLSDDDLNTLLDVMASESEFLSNL